MTELDQIVAVGSGNGQVPSLWVPVATFVLGAAVALVAAFLQHRFRLRHERWKTRLENYAVILEGLWYFSARRISINFIDRMEEIGERIVEKNYKETLNRLIREHLDHNRARLLMPGELVREYNLAYEKSMESILKIKEDEEVEKVLLVGVDDGVKKAVDKLSGQMRKELGVRGMGIYDIPRHTWFEQLKLRVRGNVKRLKLRVRGIVKL